LAIKDWKRRAGGHPGAGRAFQQQALPGVRGQAALRLPRRARSAGLRSQCQDAPAAELRDKADLLLCIYAGDIERKKIRADFGITYDSDALKLIDDLRAWGIEVLGVVITRFDNQPAARAVQEQARAKRAPSLHPPLHAGLPDRCGPDRERRRLRGQRIHRDPKAPGHRHRPRAGQREAGDLPLAALP
jgi:hypothetical protein